MAKLDWNLVKSFEQLEQERLEKLATYERNIRNKLLADTDYMILSDSPYDSKEIRKYRQELRDVTKQKGFPENINWPKKP